MSSTREFFYKYLAQTSDNPISLEIEKAEGIYLFDKNGKKYIDLIAGVSVSNVGHRHKKVIDAIKEQTDKYLHLMVYGEYIQSPQVKLAKQIVDVTPEQYNSVYFVNSGSEATEGALKLAKRYTGRTEIIAFKNAYHGSTHGALSVLGDEYFKNSFRPLLPDIKFLEFNNEQDLENISNKTACVIVEPVQGEGGVVIPKNNFLKKLQKKCNDTGALLIFDEIQTGFGRTGNLFAFETYDVRPDIFTIAKGMGGGMPLGGFVSSNKIMQVFKTNPVLGHITTFGGHPVSCAAAYASLQVILQENLAEKATKKGELFKKLLRHKKIKSIHGVGLFIAVEVENFIFLQKLLKESIKNGLIFDWFIFNDSHFRIAPPLTITNDEIELSCKIILKSLDAV